MNTEGKSTTDLAYIGDAVYELYFRTRAMEQGFAGADRLHRETVRYVCAEGQARGLKQILDHLTEDEVALVRRGKNRKSISRPKNADPMDYKWATAMECLVGWLYLEGRDQRLQEVLSMTEKAIDGRLE